MTQAVATHPEQSEEVAIYDRTVLGFWVYLMTDCILFCILFTTYIVLHGSTFGGPTSEQIYDLNLALAETGVLLASSFTSGLGMIAIKRGSKWGGIIWLCIASLFGAAFIAMEFSEFTHLFHEGYSWHRSAFLSAYFTLVGTHGLHVSVGLFWVIVLLAQILLRGITVSTFRRLVCWNMFWHFLDVVWIFIFTVVYLMGSK